MKKLLAVLLQPPIPALLGLGILSAVIYYGGQALRDWLRWDDGTLLMIIGGVWLVAVLVFLWRRYQSGKRARLIEDRLRGQAREHRESVRPDKRSQVEELEKQLGTALTTLRSSKLGKNALYELPWYVIIGPPGSGKTTLLRESNLSFPDQVHGRGVRGVGGTRNCDWWFTDQGILLDTAGRYTTQEEDRNEWMSFLDMLKKSRSLKPINGAMIAISIADLIQASDEELAEHARKIRERLAELTQRLEVVFPVYLLFSKCDLLDGFVETFGGYGSRERAQTWGFTLPYLQSESRTITEQFDAQFDGLYERVAAERLQTLGTTKSQAKKAKVFSFPMQFAHARERVRSFLGQLEQPNPYHESSDLRGVYFTSGTQEGQPLDQVLAGMREACGLELDGESAIEEPVDKKAYFIDDLFEQVVFPDKELARSSAKAQGRRTLLRRVGLAASLLITLMLIVLLVVGYTQQSSLTDRSMTAYADADRTFTLDDFAKEARLEKDGGGPFERLRLMFEELQRGYGSVGSYILGQNNALYEQRIRPLYVRQLRKVFVQPLQDRLLKVLKASDLAGKVVGTDQDGSPLDVADLQDYLMCYRMLGGDLVIQDEWLAKFLLGSRWTWAEGEQVGACRAHRDTFLAHVAKSTYVDWSYLPDDMIIEKAGELCTALDGLARTVADIRKQQGLDKELELNKVIEHQDLELIDDSVTIPMAFTRPTGIEDLLEKKAQERGDDSADKLKARDKEDAIAGWLDTLAKFRPAAENNLRQAGLKLAKLTTNSEEGVYVKIYKKVCVNLEQLGMTCPSDDVGWLTETLEDIGRICPEVETLTTRDRFERIVSDAQDKRQVKTVVDALLRVRNKIQERCEEAPKIVGNSIRTSLIHLVDLVQDALANEIVSEANQAWRDGVGKSLRDFSTSYPFDPNGKSSVDPGNFAEVFGKDTGSFDTTMKWVLFLESQLKLIQPAPVLLAGHEQDRKKIDDIQSALFSQSPTGCEITFVTQPLDEIDSVRFVLGDNEPLVARFTKEAKMTWSPGNSAAIEITGFPVPGNPEGVGATLTQQGNWGFLRLLDAAAAVGPDNLGEIEFKKVRYQRSQWNTFEVDGKLLSSGGQKARAALLYRTTAEPNPLAPDFFKHAFSDEVFRAR